jgi:hypothetical protein
VATAEGARRDTQADPRGTGGHGARTDRRLRADLERQRSGHRLDTPDRRPPSGPSGGDRREYWRTPANTESKYLFLGYCFETLGCVRVAFKTDGRNIRSQEAIARLGAVREGTLRRHMNVRGYQRDTVYFSILDDEWPAVKATLEARLSS